MNQGNQQMLTARQAGLVSCQVCNFLAAEQQTKCPRCLAPLYSRKPASQQRSTALLLTAVMLYIPAMLLPVSTVNVFGQPESSTLMGSVAHFLESGAWPVALVIFTASVLVPLLKLIGLSYLLISVQKKSKDKQLQRTRLYRLVEFVGRWSMVDVFVIALLVALVQIGAFINIIPGLGILAFSGVVVVTMFASMSFDPRLIWDD